MVFACNQFIRRKMKTVDLLDFITFKKAEGSAYLASLYLLVSRVISEGVAACRHIVRDESHACE